MALLVSGASAYALPASWPPCAGIAHTLMSAAFVQGHDVCLKLVLAIGEYTYKQAHAQVGIREST